MTTLPPIRRIAIIGAGAGGLVAARALLSESRFTAIDVYEQRSTVGGVWNYTSQASPVPVPSVDPCLFDTPVPTGSSKDPNDVGREEKVYISAVYDNLETNVPTPMQSFPTHPFPPSVPLFPHHSVVLDYLRDYAADLQHLIRFNTQITSITPGAEGKGWTLLPADSAAEDYDAVVVATGHNSIPFIPAIPGLAAFLEQHPGSILHSKNFRRPEGYAGKKVVIVGNSVSGHDIAVQLVGYVAPPLLQSARTASPFALEGSLEGVEQRGEIAAVEAEGRVVRFRDGGKVDAVDVVLFATGYMYSLPFLAGLDPPLITSGERVHGLFQNVFYTPNPTLCFVALAAKLIPFPLAQSQAAWIARVYSHRCQLPGKEAMAQWEEEEVEKKGGGRKFHYFIFPADADYFDVLEGMVDSAQGEGGLEPARWRERERWIRPRLKRIKKAYNVAKGEGRVVSRMEELGFDFEKGLDGDESAP
jgi:cation diffusion facilitator CzcD-associated flavoprotein CzcO